MNRTARHTVIECAINLPQLFTFPTKRYEPETEQSCRPPPLTGKRTKRESLFQRVNNYSNEEHDNGELPAG